MTSEADHSPPPPRLEMKSLTLAAEEQEEAEAATFGLAIGEAHVTPRGMLLVDDEKEEEDSMAPLPAEEGIRKKSDVVRWCDEEE